jgi:hypothetical protein
MGTHRSAVGILSRVLAALTTYIAHGSAVRPKLVCDEPSRWTVAPHRFLQESLSCQFMAFLGHETFQDLAFMIDNPP